MHGTNGFNSVCESVSCGGAVCRRWLLTVLMATGAAYCIAAEGEEQLYPPGVTFETDMDMAAVLERAQDLAAAKEYGAMSEEVQELLDAGEGPVLRVDQNLYMTARGAGLRLLASVPPEALAAYRTLVDPQAQALLRSANAANEPEAVLREVVARFLRSSVGDDAAFRLACRYLTRGEFGEARRRLAAIERWTPDTDIPARQLHVTRAVAAGGANAGTPPSVAVERRPEHDMGEAAEELPAARAWLEQRVAKGGPRELAWPMPWGNPRRDAAPAVPDAGPVDADAPPFVARWEVVPARAGTQDEAAFRRKAEVRVQAWQVSRRAPADKLISAGGRVYLSNREDVRCLSLDGRTLWAKPGTSPFKDYDRVAMRGFKSGMTRVYDFDLWTTFEDRTEGRVSVVGDTLYRIEGTWASGRRLARGGARGTRGELVRSGSRIVAYDAATGEQRFAVGKGGETGNGEFGGARFLNAPVPCGPHLLVACEQEGALFLVAISPDSGTVAWKRELCRYALEYDPPDGAAGVLVDDATVYLVTGEGVVVCADGYDGQLRWAATYEHHRDDALILDPSAFPRTPTWKENALFLVEGALLVTPDDAPSVLVFDPRDGELLHQTHSQGALHALGIRDGTFVAQANDRLLAFDARGGLDVLWRQPLDESPTGNGLVAGAGVLLPYPDRIDRRSLKTGELEASLPAGTDRRAPLGNLVADGTHLYASGIGHAMALRSPQTSEAAFAGEMAGADDAATHLRRGVFRIRARDFAGAVEDLEKAQAGGGGRVVREALLRALDGAIAEGVGDVAAHAVRARELAVTGAEARRAALAEARFQAGQGRFFEAAGVMLQAAARDDRSPMRPDWTLPGWSVSPDAWVRVQFDRLIAQHGDPMSDAVDAAASERIKTILQDDDGAVVALVRLMQSLPPARAAARAGLAAGVVAELKGALVRAELIYLRMAESEVPVVQSTGWAGLARFCERRNWPGYAFRTWSRVQEGPAGQTALVASFPAADIATDERPPLEPDTFEEAKADALAARAIQELRETAQGPLDATPTAPLPPPPYERVWHTEDWDAIGEWQTESGVRSRFTDTHLLALRRDPAQFRCLDIADGAEVWTTDLPEGGMNFLFRGHALLLLQPKLAAVSGLSGATLWEGGRRCRRWKPHGTFTG